MARRLACFDLGSNRTAEIAAEKLRLHLSASRPSQRVYALRKLELADGQEIEVLILGTESLVSHCYEVVARLRRSEG